MSKTKKIIFAIACVAIIAILATAFFTGGSLKTVPCLDCDGAGTVLSDDGIAVVCEACEGSGQVRASFWALVPPLIAIGLALITKEVYSSLFVGIAAGALLGANFKFTGTMDNITLDGLTSAVSDNAGIFIFIVILGIIVALVNKAGGSAAFGNWAQHNIKSRSGAMLATFALGVLIFIDDYFNCLTVGSVMRPVTDGHNVSRAKLSYLIDATAAPICMIAPISSWAAAVSSYANEGEGLSLFIKAIPYNFYSLLTLVFIVAITLMKFDYGSMRIHEINAKQKGDLFTSGEKVAENEESHSSNGKVIDLILPIIVLIACCAFALVYVGGIFDGASVTQAFSDTDAFVGLPWGSIIALIFTIAFLCLRKVITIKEAMDAIPKGFAMVPAILILTFATALKNMTGILGSKPFVADAMSHVAGNFQMFLPAIIFLVACFISFATGTSWGTFGILIPIVMTIFKAGDPLQIISMSACLAGSVCGDHCSPISDTTIMSSAGGQCNHLNHVSTQIPYAVSVAAISFVMYLISGFVQNVAVVLPLGVVLTVVFLFVMKMTVSKKYGKDNI
ncbi:MAG: Na+/H+ antiporter NhaC family protein [Clostridia bacterium]|nr:Na+/H+ antiporter NhaC family protein [Clostridia bacterium]